MQKLLAVALLFCTLSLYGQGVKVTGVVSDSTGEGLIGVTIVEAGTSNGTISGVGGVFELLVSDPAKASLTLSLIGYKDLSIPLNGRTELRLVLRSSLAALGEVMVIGYRTTTKKEFTGAASKVDGNDLAELNVARMDQALQGQVAGVTISTNSGSPGGAASIRIRGLSTFGDNDPLILVDGVVYDSEGLNSLDPNDIKSVIVLKDATAGIYGVRAANGVILIETKSGAKDAPPRLEVNSFGGVQQTARRLDLLNATEYAVIKNEMFANGDDPLPFPNVNLGAGTDWQDAVFQNASIMSHNVSLSGGGDKVNYSVGGTYFSQDGIVGGDKANFTRINGRANFGIQMSDWLRFNHVSLFTSEERDALPENGIGSVLYNTINAFPTDPVRDADGKYTYLEEVSDIINPIAQMEQTYNTSWVSKFVGKEEFEMDLGHELQFTNRFNYNHAVVTNKIFSPLTWFGPGKAQNTALNEDLDPTQVELAPGTFIDRGASVTEGSSTFTDLNFESFLNHHYKLGHVHELRSTLGISVFTRTGENLTGTAYNIPNNSLDYADISANLAPGGYLNNVTSWQFEERLLSAFLRAEYTYAKRYFVSAIVRRDGSSKFGPNKRFGTFPSVSASWMLSEEDFYPLASIPFFKVRFSYGVSGNDQIPNFAYRALLNGEGVYVLNDIIVQGVAIGRAANPDLKWETTSQANLGFDLSLKDHWEFSTNFFIKNTRDLLFQPDVSAVLGSYGPGGSAPVINAGDVQNRGVELELRYSADFGKNWGMHTGFNFTHIVNEVISTPEGLDFLPGAAFGVGGNIATRFQQGFPIGYFIGYETDGVFQTQAEIDNSPVQQEGAEPGDLRYVDQNGDGVINFNDDSDRKMIGSPIPDLTIGWNFSLNYRQFDLSAFTYAAIGQEIIRNYERQQPYANQRADVINRWVGTGSTNEQPRLTTDRTRNGVFSDFFVEDGSFLRLRNVQVGYTLSKGWAERVHMQGLRIYVSANNLLTITSYQGFDPEIGSLGGPLSAGVDLGFYPQARSIMTGVSIKL